MPTIEVVYTPRFHFLLLQGAESIEEQILSYTWLRFLLHPLSNIVDARSFRMRIWGGEALH